MIIDSPIVSGSYAASGSFNQFGDVVISGSLTVTGSIIGTASLATTASFAATASYAANVPITASYALSASQATTASYLSGYVSPFPFTGSAIISGSLGITGSLSVTNFSGSGVRYLVTDASGSVTAQSASAAIKTTQAFTATAGQTTFAVTNGYSTGYVDVFVNGSKLNATEFTDTSGTNIVLTTGSFVDDVVEVVKYLPASGVSNNVLRQLTTFVATASQTVFNVDYTPGLLDVYFNGSHLTTSDYTANNGTSITLATASAANDILDVYVYSYQVGAFSGIGGQGVTNQVAFFNTTSSISGSNNLTFDGSSLVLTGSFTVSGSSTFTNIGPTVLSGSVGVSGSLAVGGVNVVLVNQTSSLNVATASFAATASSADNFLTRGTITAQTLVVQTITSSVDFVTGSTRFGSLSSNTHVFTGSMSVSGGASFNTAQNFTVRSTSTGWVSSFTNDYNNTSYIGVDNDGMYSQPSSKGNKIVAGNGTTYLYVTSSNIGIGNTNPQATLHLGAVLNTMPAATSIAVAGDTSIRFMGGSDGNANYGSYIAGTQYGGVRALSLGYRQGAGDILTMTITQLSENSGSVGIGTTSPGQTLEIRSANGQGIRLKNAGSSDKRWDIVGSGNDLRVNETGVGAVMTFEAGGNVGIGTTDPSFILDVNDTNASGARGLRISNSSTSAGPALVLSMNAGTYTNWAIGNSYEITNALEFRTSNSVGGNPAAAGTTRMLITNGGFVGIGTNNPDTLLTLDTQIANFSTGILARLYASKGTTEGAYLQIAATRHSTQSVRRVELYAYDGASNNANMVLQPNGGFVGIGTYVPSKPLQVNAAVANEVAQFNNTRNNGSGDYAMVTTLGAADNNTSNYHYIAATGGADKYYLYGNGTYTTVSDARLKKNITTVTDTYLDKVNNLRVVNYNWNDQQEGSPLELGMIAQEVEELIPSIVYEGREQEDGNTYKGIQVSSLPYILIKAIQELKSENDSLKSRIEILENK